MKYEKFLRVNHRIYSSILFLVLFINFPSTNSKGIQCNFTKVWGLGLEPEHAVLPARYFFIESYDEDGERLYETPGKDVFSVNIFSPTHQLCRIRSEVLDRQDGSFIVRYKLYSTCQELIISVQCLGSELPHFPYHIKNTISSETCPCTFYESTEEWLQKLGCKKHYKRIETDLGAFESIDFHQVLKAAEKTFLKDTHRHSICHYKIKENQIYRRCYGQYTGFKMFVDANLLFITRTVKIPDVEILVNLGDWPLITTAVELGKEKMLIPMFSWCGSKDSWDIVMPTYDITESSLENLGRVTLDLLSVQGNTGPRWKDKTPQLFWRGRDSSRERLKLIEIARKNRSLINASLTDFFFFRDEQAKYGPKEKRVSFFEFFQFKYQLNMDGTVAAYRFPYLLAGDSVVFKQDSPYYEFFYDDLTEWKEYIPVKRDLSDLVEKLEWAVKHDEEAHKIALNGQKYARENLNPHNIFCYHVKLLYEYSKKQVNQKIDIPPDMEKVNQDSKKFCQCEKISKSMEREEL